MKITDSELIEEEIVRDEAESIASEYSLDVERVFSVMTEIERYRQYKFDSEKVPYDVKWRPSLSCIGLDVALRYLDPELALELFESHDARRIARRALFVSYLAHDDTPLYSLYDLTDLAERFCGYLEDNRTAIVDTGFPESGFAHSLWVATRLAQNYYVRLPIGVDVDKLLKGEAGYVFATETNRDWNGEFDGGRYIRCISPVEALLRNGLVIIEMSGVYRVVSDPSLSPIVPGLTEEEIDRLQELRPKLWKAKLDIVVEAARAVCKRDFHYLWRRSLCILTKAFTADEADFLLDVDKRYTGWDLVAGRVGDDSDASTLPPGGLSDLFGLIGHYEKELKIGTYACTHEQLGDLVNEQLVTQSRLRVRSYFELVSLKKRDLIEDAYLEFRDKEKREMLFWREFSQRVNRAVQDEFEDVCTLTVRRPRRTRDAFEHGQRAIVDAIEGSLRAAAEMPHVVSVLADAHPAESINANIFRPDGDGWWVQLAKQSGHYKHSLGMKYLHVLLGSPNVPIPIPRLLSIIHRDPDDESAEQETYSAMCTEQLEDENLFEAFYTAMDEDIDQDGYDLAVTAIDELKVEIERARQLGASQDRIGNLEEMARAARTYRDSNYDDKGRSRAYADPFKKQRQSIDKAIGDTRKHIGETHKLLASHLKSCVHVSIYSVIYEPSLDITWITS